MNEFYEIRREAEYEINKETNKLKLDFYKFMKDAIEATQNIVKNSYGADSYYSNYYEKDI